MLHKFRDTRGAISILVILIIVILATFGTTILLVSNSSLILANKTINKTQDYYVVDSNAESILPYIDTYLYLANYKAKIYMQDGFVKSLPPNETDETDETMLKSFMYEINRVHPNFTLRSANINEIYTRLYYYYASKDLEKAQITNSSIYIEYGDDYANAYDFLDFKMPSPDKNSLKIYYSAYDENINMVIDVVLGVQMDYNRVSYDDTDDWKETLTMIPNEKFKRYAVLQWQQRQSYDQGLIANDIIFDGVVSKD